MKWCWPLILDHRFYFYVLSKYRPCVDKPA